MAADSKVTVEADTSGAVRSVKTLETAFASLKTQLLGLGIGAVLQQTLQFAQALDQASRASGVGLNTVASFSKAVASLGGDASRAAGDVVDFVSGLDAAKKGSASAQIDLARIGVTLSDLAKLSNEDLFKKTVLGIAAIGDASERNRLAVQQLGRSFKDIDIRDVAAKLNAGGAVDTAAIQSAAAAQRNLSIQFAKFQEVLLQVLQPISEFIANLEVSKETMKTWIVAGLKLVAVLGAFTVLEKVAAGILAYSRAINRATLDTDGFAAGMYKQGGSFAKFNDGLMMMRAAFDKTNLGVGQGVGVLGVVGRFASLASAGLASMIPLVGQAAAAFIVLDGVLNQFTGKGFIDWIQTSGDEIERMVTSRMPRLAAAINAVGKSLGMGAGVIERDADAKAAKDKLANLKEEQAEIDKVRKATEDRQAKEQMIVDAFRAQRLEQEKIVANYKQQNADTLRQLNFQNTLIGKTQEEQDKSTKLFELETTYIKEVNGILQKNAELRAAAAVGTKEEQAAYAAYSANVQSTIMKLAEQYGIQLDAATKLVDRGQGLALLEKDRQNTLERITAQMEQQARISEAMTSARLKIGGEKQDLSFQRGLIGFGNLTKQRLTIVEESRKAGNEAARAYAAAFEGEDLTAAQAQQFADGLKAIEEGYAEIRDLQLSNLAASQEWSAGWREAFQNYADEAENSARQASDYFSTFTKGWEDAIVNFVRTGKLSFKDLANSMIAEFAKIQAQKMFVQLFGGAGNAGGGLLGSLFGGLFGKAGGGAVNAGQPYMVGESGRELFVPNSAGKIVPGDMMGNQPVNVTYNINATDAQSFRTMIARDPQFIYNVTEAGRRSQPSRRLA